MKTNILSLQNMMDDVIFVSNMETCLTFKENQTFLIFNPPYPPPLPPVPVDFKLQLGQASSSSNSWFSKQLQLVGSKLLASR